MEIKINIKTTDDSKALNKYLKDKGIKMTGLIQFLNDNKEILDKLIDQIPQDDLNYRFKNSIKEGNKNERN